MKIKIALVLILLVLHLSNAQSGHGFSFENYNSIFGLTINPAFSIESKAKWQINGISYNNLNFTDMGKISPYDFKYLSTPNGFDGVDYDTEFPPEETVNNVHSERDWLLPSVIYKFSDRISAGLILRSRALVNYSNINGFLFEVINQGESTKSSSETYPNNSSFNFTNTAHYWNEVGLNFSVSIANMDNHIIKIGGTAKWLTGQGVVNLTGTNFQSSLNTLNQLIISSGTITYLNTFKAEEKNKSNILAGPFQNFFNSTSTSANFGGDAGLVWEIRTSNTNRLARGLSESAVNLYKVKLSAAILDFGSITYDTDVNDEMLPNRGILNDTYEINAFTALISSFPQSNLVEVLEQNAAGSEVERSQPRGEVKVALPTSLNFNVDYLVKSDNNYYVNINYLHPIRENEEDFTNQRMQLLTVTPRFEKPDWSVYIPVSIGLNTDWAVGVGGRYKYVTAGFSIPEFGGINFLYIGFNAPLMKL